jgi:hypothetical protein
LFQHDLAADEADLIAFAREHAGVEAYLEPRVAGAPGVTVVFVADTGQWTRRRVTGPQAAQALARRLDVPAYEASVVGYPQRMRDWTRTAAR